MKIFLKFFSFLFFFSALWCKHAIFIPDSHLDVGKHYPQKIEGKAYSALNIFGKIQYLLSEKDWTIEDLNFSDVSLHRGKIFNKNTRKEIDIILMHNLPYFIPLHKILAIPPEKKIIFLWEPPTIIEKQYDQRILKRFHKVYTVVDSLVDNKHFFKFYYPSLKPMIPLLPEFNEKKLCCTIIGNKSSQYHQELYTERKRAILFFEKLRTNEFDLYGFGWEKEGYQCYKGKVGNKTEVLKNYKFSICYENTLNLDGYITEKIFDCFAAGCIPIYLGANNITDYIPPECFIDMREFSSYNALYDYIKNISEKEYNQYIQAIQRFLKSDKAQLYTMENFIKTESAAIFTENRP